MPAVPIAAGARSLRARLPLGMLAGLMAAGLAAPLAMGAAAPGFYLEVLLGGLMSGVLYALVALGLVLIYKSSGVYNFAQGAMVLLAALATARMSEVMPLPVAVGASVLMMLAFAWLVERLVLRPLINQAPTVVFMATLGIF